MVVIIFLNVAMVSLTGIIRKMHNTRAAHGTITSTVGTTVVEVEYKFQQSREQTRRAANDAPDGYRLTAFLPSQFSPSTHCVYSDSIRASHH
jgi:hypothetical protein